MGEKLREWLSQELDRLNWSHRELARKSDLSQSIVSKTIRGDRNPSAEFCIKVATALGQPPEKLLRLADILPDTQEDDPTLTELFDSLRNMSSEQRKEVLRYVHFLQSRQDEK